MRILRGLASRRLGCGCLAGTYETYNGEVIEVVDWHATTCRDAGHLRRGAVQAAQPLAAYGAPRLPRRPQHR